MDPISIIALLTLGAAIGVSEAELSIPRNRLGLLYAKLQQYVLEHPDLIEPMRQHLLVELDRYMDLGLEPPGILLHHGKWVQIPDASVVVPHPPRLTAPASTEVFYVQPADFHHLDEHSWMGQRMREEIEGSYDLDPGRVFATPLDELPEEDREEIQAIQRELAGWYWWSCMPGCMPDSEATGPFDSEDEAIVNAREGLDAEEEMPEWGHVISVSTTISNELRTAMPFSEDVLAIIKARNLAHPAGYYAVFDTALGELPVGPFNSFEAAEQLIVDAAESAG